MTDSPIGRTIRSYDRIATNYLAHWHDRSAMANYVHHFASLLHSADPNTPALVADIGCGPGFDSVALRQLGLQVVSLDLSRGMLTAGRQTYPGIYLQADMRYLPFSRRFDGLWVNASLLHFPRPDVPPVLAGFTRVLQPGGLLFLAVKQGEGEEWQMNSYGQPEPRFYTYWQPNDLDSLLHQFNLTIVDGWSEAQNRSTTWLIRFARLENHT